MEELIKQAFLHVEVVGPQVQEGHYDLIGPDGEIILPTVWEKVVQPDWSITMHMWPMERMPQRPPIPPMGGPGGMPRPPHGHNGHRGEPHHGRIPMRPFAMGARPMGHPPGGAVPVPPPPPGAFFQGRPGGGRPMPMSDPDIIEVGPGKPPKRVSRGGGGGTTVLAWMTGAKPKGGGKKYVGPAPIKPRSYYTAQYVQHLPYKSVPIPITPLIVTGAHINDNANVWLRRRDK